MFHYLGGHIVACRHRREHTILPGVAEAALVRVPLGIAFLLAGLVAGSDSAVRPLDGNILVNHRLVVHLYEGREETQRTYSIPHR